MKKNLFPVTLKFVVKPHSEYIEELEKYTGLIIEYYNTMPWSSESYGMSIAMSVRMACSYINFASRTYDLGGSPFTEQDEFGLTFQRVNYIGENTVYGGYVEDWTLEQEIDYEIANGGGKGVVVSAAQPYRYGGWSIFHGNYQNAAQPVTHVGSSCEFVELSASDSSSGSENTWDFGWMGAIFTGNCLPVSTRSKDMVMWFYDLAYDTGVWQYEMNTEGVPDDRLFTPGSRGVRKISNEYKYAPWARYPDLL